MIRDRFPALAETERARRSLKVAVLMGGPSEEHDISIRSGRGVVDALRRRRWMAEPLVIPSGLTVPQACDAARQALLQAGAEVAFIALHGAFGEDGTVQQVCEDLRIAYTGSDAAASRLGMDKVASKRRFEQAGLPVPRWRAVDAGVAREFRRVEGFAYPLVVKPARQGSSLGVSIVEQPGALSRAVALAGEYGAVVILEEWIAGRELTVGILGDSPLPVIEICPRQRFFNYAAKYTPGMTEYHVPAPLPAEVAARIQAIGYAAHQALGCRHLSRADLMLSRDGAPFLLEVNTIPGFTPTSLLPKASASLGISYDKLCERLVLMAWRGAAPRRQAIRSIQ